MFFNCMYSCAFSCVLPTEFLFAWCCLGVVEAHGFLVLADASLLLLQGVSCPSIASGISQTETPAPGHGALWHFGPSEVEKWLSKIELVNPFKPKNLEG